MTGERINNVQVCLFSDNQNVRKNWGDKDR